MHLRVRESARVGIEFADQARGGEERERVAGIGGMGNDTLGMLMCLRRLFPLPVILRP